MGQGRRITCSSTTPGVPIRRDGTLLMFPSYLEHSVDANKSNDERVSVSFNLMFSFFTHCLSKPLW